MTDARPIKIDITLEPWQTELLRSFHIPDGMCGETVSERASFILDEWCESIRGARERRASHPRGFEGDDEVPF